MASSIYEASGSGRSDAEGKVANVLQAVAHVISLAHTCTRPPARPPACPPGHAMRKPRNEHRSLSLNPCNQ